MRREAVVTDGHPMEELQLAAAWTCKWPISIQNLILAWQSCSGAGLLESNTALVGS